MRKFNAVTVALMGFVGLLIALNIAQLVVSRSSSTGVAELQAEIAEVRAALNALEAQQIHSHDSSHPHGSSPYDYRRGVQKVVEDCSVDCTVNCTSWGMGETISCTEWCDVSC